MNNVEEVFGKYIDKLFEISHDEQFVALKKQDSEFLKDILFRVSSRHAYTIINCKHRGDHNNFSHVIEISESAYILATIATILRSRGVYGNVKEE